MAATDVSFDFYEGIRIVIPGGLAVALLEGILASFGSPAGPAIAANLIVVIALTVGVGLLLYYIDMPTKSAAYRVNQPTSLIKTWLPDLKTREITQAYLVLLDTQVPPAIAARALYMGSIFRIGFEAILLLGVAQAGLWAATQFRPDAPVASGGPAVAASLVTLAILLAARAYTSARREEERRVRRVVGRVRRDIGFWRGFVLSILMGLLLWTYASTLLKLGSNLPAESRSVIAGGVLFVWVSLLWGPTPFRRPAGGRPMDPFTSLLLFSVGSSVLLSESYRDGFSGLQDSTPYAWLAAPIVVAVLIAARGHERRLGGAYGSQRKWLELNKPQVMSWLTGDPLEPIRAEAAIENENDARMANRSLLDSLMDGLQGLLERRRAKRE